MVPSACAWRCWAATPSILWRPVILSLTHTNTQCTHRREYGAERMCLAVLGGDPLDTMEAWARELFEGVRGGHCGPAPTFENAGFPFEVGVDFVYV